MELARTRLNADDYACMQEFVKTLKDHLRLTAASRHYYLHFNYSRFLNRMIFVMTLINAF